MAFVLFTNCQHRISHVEKNRSLAISLKIFISFHVAAHWWQRKLTYSQVPPLFLKSNSIGRIKIRLCSKTPRDFIWGNYFGTDRIDGWINTGIGKWMDAGFTCRKNGKQHSPCRLRRNVRRATWTERWVHQWRKSGRPHAYDPNWWVSAARHWG